MQLWSKSFEHGGLIPEKYAFGRPHAVTHMEFSQNINPHLGWVDVPTTAKSLAIVAYDVDVPTVFDDVNQVNKTLAADMPRMDFHHWGLADFPASRREIAEGEFSSNVVAGGKKADSLQAHCRHALNDYTMAFAADPAMAGQYFGYDGPCPPWNDLRMHHYHFVLYALDVPSLRLPVGFDCHQLRKALQRHIIESAILTGQYTLNPTILSQQPDMLFNS